MKKLELTNKVLIVLSILVNTLYLVLRLLGKYEVNILIIFSFYVLLILPLILKKMKVNVSDFVEFMYILFIIIACLMGSIMHFYQKIYWFDSFAHYVSGILTAFLGFILLVRFNKFDKKSLAFNVTYIIFVTLAIAATWEIFEFSADSILGGDAQKVLITGVTDTMKDIICALLGNVIVAISYLYEYKNSKKMLVYNFIEAQK